MIKMRSRKSRKVEGVGVGKGQGTGARIGASDNKRVVAEEALAFWPLTLAGGRGTWLGSFYVRPRSVEGSSRDRQRLHETRWPLLLEARRGGEGGRAIDEMWKEGR